MQIYRIEKKDKICYVTPMQFIEYKQKWRTLKKKMESRPFRKDVNWHHNKKSKKVRDE